MVFSEGGERLLADKLSDVVRRLAKVTLEAPEPPSSYRFRPHTIAEQAEELKRAGRSDLGFGKPERAEYHVYGDITKTEGEIWNCATRSGKKMNKRLNASSRK